MTTGGKCLCGAVRFQLREAAQETTLCHCAMCRNWCGGMPFAGVNAKVTLQQSDSLRWWNSSEWGERGFCGDCGSSLFWRSPGLDIWEISAGALACSDGLKLAGHIFIDNKAAFYELADNAPRHTGAEHTAAALSDLAAQYGDEFLRDALTKSRRHFGGKFADEVEKLISAKQK